PARSRPPSPEAGAPTKPRWASWWRGSCGWTARPGPPTQPTRWPWPSATCGAATPRPTSPGPARSSPAESRPPAGRAVGETPQSSRETSTVIAFLSGRVASRGAGTAVIDGGGVGMTGHCTPATLARLHVGEEATVATALVVREDSLTLFGFADDDERDTFERLQTASGVGPRLALAMLAVHTPDALRRAVAAEDTAALTRVPGIGKKGAQRIVLELKGKLGEPVGGDEPAVPGRPAA